VTLKYYLDMFSLRMWGFMKYMYRPNITSLFFMDDLDIFALKKCGMKYVKKFAYVKIGYFALNLNLDLER